MKRPSTRSLIVWPIIVLAAGFVVYKMKFAPTPVIVHTVVRGEIVAEVMGTGTLEAHVKTTVSARIQERLLEIMVDQGDTVKAGQLLARLDDAEAKQQVAIAEAALATAKQTAARIQADLARSEAVLAQARLNHKRMVGLVSRQAVSQSDTDKSSEALLVAEADLQRSNAAIAESAGQIVVAEKTLQFRQKQLAFTEIHAPYDGLVIRRDRDAGDMLVPGASLMEIISLDEIWVSAWVDETAIPDVKADQPARIAFRSDPSRQYAGKVSRLGRETDRETREFLVDVRAVELPENWTIGQRAEVFIESARENNAVLVPAAFIVWKESRAGVFVNAGGKAKWREITPGLRGIDQISVTKGLSEGDQLLRLPEVKQVALTENQRIKIP